MDTPLQILTVDDEPSVIQSMRFIFTAPKYEVTGVESGNAALARLDTKIYDIIIIDQKMPHLTGVQLLQEIRRRNFAGKILILSALLSPEVRESYQEMNVDLILEKPFNVCDLRSALERLAA